MDENFDFGMVGLGVMGRNFILNVADHGYSAIGLDTDAQKVEALTAEGTGKQVEGTVSKEVFVKALKSPRKIMLLVPAGKIVDAVIEDLLPLLDKGDLIIDGGNSFFPDTNRRITYLADKGIHFMGVGVSGGAEGARFGPSIMPGGPKEGYALIEPIFRAVAAKVDEEPCVAHMGNTSAGNYVKMVHNGIEYGLMQLIAETYDVMKRGLGLSNETIGQTFGKWSEGRLKSFLVEITADIFKQKDPLTGEDLVDKILDKAKQKGTGKWTSQNAMDLGMPVPTIDAAVTMRGISALKEQRSQASKVFDQAKPELIADEQWADTLEQGLYSAFVITYAQGLAQLSAASLEYSYELNISAVARIWRGGCIIRASLLEHIRKAYERTPALKNLLLDDAFAEILDSSHNGLRSVLKLAIDTGIPVSCLGASLSYFDAFKSEKLPLNLVQAQRDYFGSHTYERTDQQGVFHTEWG
ncbi:NADP-dependent phosphogluconate dehydrogenase [Fulvivirgaceae bacterium BMA12]|uniref:6-phosphogluconate dehydrogenase, decarboxylating n=1 Tax=Agaribacillus aureus TaxID=3051825 RepID=A0ABT8L775_9BACT|nr:NADP-dependent phosphogluconate dehydrogenase [Fulvivirgaceae bacterium BMA12]